MGDHLRVGDPSIVPVRVVSSFTRHAAPVHTRSGRGVRWLLLTIPLTVLIAWRYPRLRNYTSDMADDLIKQAAA